MQCMMWGESDLSDRAVDLGNDVAFTVMQCLELPRLQSELSYHSPDILLLRTQRSSIEGGEVDHLEKPR